MSVELGNLIESLGVTLTLTDEDLVSDAVVIAKVIEIDGSVRLAIGWSDGMSWVERLGMVTAAAQMEAVSGFDGRGDDDD